VTLSPHTGTVRAAHDALAPTETNRRLVQEAGFELLVDDVIRMTEPESETALWVLGRRPG
jgi:hypothetical protein